MKKRMTLFIFLAVVFCQFTIGQDFHWVRSFGSFLGDHCHSIAVDNDGNTYAAGTFGSVSASWNGGGYYESTPYLFIEGDTLLNNGFQNMFLVKYDQSGNLLWAKSIGGWNNKDSFESAGGLVYDAANNYIYFSGCATGTVVIGSITLHCSNTDVFLTKFDLNGNCMWGKNFIGSGSDIVRSMCVDDRGNIYLTGQNTDSMTIQDISVEKGAFLAKFDPFGFCLLAKKIFSPNPDSKYVIPYSIKTLNNNIVVGGETTAHIVTVDTIQITDTHYNGSYIYQSGLLAKFDSLGRVLWAKFLGSPSAAIWAVDFDPAGDVYSTGWFQDACFFDSLSMVGSGGFIVKCNSSGDIIFLHDVGPTGYTLPNDIQTDESGNCFTTGVSRGTVTFGGTTFTADGAFLLKYFPDGAVVWAKQIQGGAFGGKVLGINVNSNGSVIALTGEFSDSISVDSITIHNSGSNIFGAGDVFIARYDGSLGIEDKNTSTLNALLIFPNPAPGRAFIIVPDDFMNEKSLILSMIDQVGNIQLQETTEIKGDKITQELEGFPKGFYIVSLSNGRKKYFGKLVVQ